MGQICGICGTHQAQVKVFTKTLDPAYKATDVVAVQLACGHKIGNKEFMEFQKLVNEINSNIAKKMEELQDSASGQISAAWEKIRGGGKK